MIYEVMRVVINHLTATVTLLAPLQDCTDEVVTGIPWQNPNYAHQEVTEFVQEGCLITYYVEAIDLPIHLRGYSASEANVNSWRYVTGRRINAIVIDLEPND